jgi:ABC-type glycerol-3-phosphate transport system substrate-binding protein
VWLPAQFDPSAGTPAGDILFARLREFTSQNPRTIEVRLKAMDGEGGLLESLAAANAAAPLALPDLVALPRPLLESAALKGLLHPYDGLSEVMDNNGWYDYARQLAYLQESVFGLPFAGDALVLVYRPAVIDVPPQNWESALGFGNPLAFSAADPQALFTINQYEAAGGAVWDDQGRPMLDEVTLTKVLAFYQQASQAGVMPIWLTQLETNEQVWQAFAEGQAPMAIAWASYYFNGSPALTFETMIAPQITTDGNVYSLATGWVWALASPDPARRQLAAQLAEFLVDINFLGKWNTAAGYLPPHSDSLAEWGDEQMRSLVGQISLTAQLIPSEDLLSSLGPALENAVVLVLKQQADPQTAAKIATERVNQP